MTSALLILLLAQGELAGVAARPDPEGVPTKVTASIVLLDMTDIVDVRQSFTADVFMALEWKDSRLVEDDAKDPVDEVRRFYLSQVWHPSLQVLNEKSLTAQFPQVVSVTRDGTVTYKQRFIGTFTIPLHLANFPFDSHRLPISIVAAGYAPDEVEFVAHSQLNGREGKLTLAGWSIDEGHARIAPYHVDVLDRSVAGFELEFGIRRVSLFYLLRLIGPLLLIVLIGWGTCWINPLDTAAQIRLGATGFLTLVAYQFAVGGLLPKVSYLTRMDMFVAGITLIIFCCLGKAVLGDHLRAKGHEQTVVKINRAFRWAYLGAVLLVTTIAFWL
ncbi:MAG: hypothetical protein ACYS0E_04025 [Planctomycetota bacterium]|jgi:hypothetical protein